MSLKAALKLGGAPTVRLSACMGFQVPTTAVSAMIVMSKTFNIR
jgi:hypothetical protein